MNGTRQRAILAGSVLTGILCWADTVSGQQAANPAQVRLTTREYADVETIKDRSGAAGVTLESRILKGDPSRLGLYTILLKVPPHTRIAAHSHPDERVGTVIEGTWYFGYGDRFDENALKALPPGSFFTEPAGAMHFSRSGDAAVLVQITGVGPTGTDYADPARQKFDGTRD